MINRLIGRLFAIWPPSGFVVIHPSGRVDVFQRDGVHVRPAPSGGIKSDASTAYKSLVAALEAADGNT